MNRKECATLAGIWLATIAGCEPQTTGPTSKFSTRARPAPFSKLMTASNGSDPAIVGLSWGGSPSTGRVLAALRKDGRVDLYRPHAGTQPFATAGRGDLPATSLALLGGGKFVLGDDQGLVAWSVEPTGCQRLGRLDCGAVTALAAADGEIDEGYAGLRDGSVLRFRVNYGEVPLRSTARYRPEPKKDESTTRSIAPVASLTTTDDGKGVSVHWSDGQSERLRRELGPASSAVSELPVAEVQQGKLRARLLPGPLLIVDDIAGREPSRRLGLGWRATTLAIAGGGAAVMVGEEGQFLLVNLATPGPISPEMPRVLPAAPGLTLVAAEPDGKLGLVAMADASGRLEVADPEAIVGRTGPRLLDEVPELAFVPWERLRQPRSVDPKLVEPKLPTVSPSTAADLSNPESLRMLGEAADEFARSGRIDREADVRQWRGRVMIPDLDGLDSTRDPRKVDEGINELARAATLYEAATPPLLRQARICDAERAWALLTRGEIRAAEATLRPVLAFSAIDPVLGQAPELDAIAGAIAAAKGDWLSAGRRFDRVLDQLHERDRDAIRKRALLAKLGLLAASGRIQEASDLFEKIGARETDAEVRLRGLTARIRCGHPVATNLIIESKDAHIRGRIEAAEMHLSEADGSLAEAIEEYRRSGRPQLSAEAALERAEALELRGVYREAQALYESIVRAPQSISDRSEAATRPVAMTGPRASRGLARCLLAVGRPDAALMALEQGGLNAWIAESGETAVRSSPMALASESSADLEELRKARSTSGPDDLRVRDLERKLAADGRLLAPRDPISPFDPASLRLGRNEAVLVYAHLGPDAILGFLIRPDQAIEARRLPISRGDLRNAIASWRSALADGGRGLSTTDESPGLGLLGTLSVEPGPTKPAVDDLKPISPNWDAYLDEALIQPFNARLHGVDRLIIIPSSEIAALPVEVVGRSSRLLARVRVSYFPSLAALQARRDESRLTFKPGRESLWLSTIASSGTPSSSGAATIVVSGTDARPSRLIGPALADCGVVRLSAPANLDPKRTSWAQAELRLAADNRVPWLDGRLTATDLLRLPLRARLLILDVGDSAARDSFSGRGIRTLARSGLAAGAETVLVSLWDVPDASSRGFFSEFRAALAAGATPSDALDRTRRVLARDPSTRDPVHWAGFVLYGYP